MSTYKKNIRKESPNVLNLLINRKDYNLEYTMAHHRRDQWRPVRGSFYWPKGRNSRKLLGNRLHWFWRPKVSSGVGPLVEVLLLSRCFLKGILSEWLSPQRTSSNNPYRRNTCMQVKRASCAEREMHERCEGLSCGVWESPWKLFSSQTGKHEHPPSCLVCPVLSGSVWQQWFHPGVCSFH